MHDFVMPIGPQSPAMKEPMLIKLSLDGNTVKEAELRMGYTHKGIEKLLEGKNIDGAMYVASRICGICSMSHERAFLRVIEDMEKIELQERVKNIRMIIFELERIASHILWTGYMMHEIGYDTMFQYFWKEREPILDLFENICGNRVHKNMCKVGTLRYDMTEEQKKMVLGAMDRLETKLKEYEKEILTRETVKERLYGKGIISARMAEDYGLTGPIARASNIDQDIRKADPYDNYAKMKFSAITGKSGDSLERTAVRIREVYESIGIIRQCINEMPDEALKPFTLTSMKDGEGTGRVEAPRGELFHYAKIKGNTIDRMKVRTPTFGYIGVLSELLKGAELSDVPVIIASLDPCFSCMERVMVAKGSEKKWMSEKEFRDFACSTK